MVILRIIRFFFPVYFRRMSKAAKQAAAALVIKHTFSYFYLSIENLFWQRPPYHDLTYIQLGPLARKFKQGLKNVMLQDNITQTTILLFQLLSLNSQIPSANETCGYRTRNPLFSYALNFSLASLLWCLLHLIKGGYHRCGQLGITY